MKKFWTILIMIGRYEDCTYNVYCTKDELQVVADALWLAQDKTCRSGVACIAKEGRDMPLSRWSSNYDYKFADCM